MAKLYFRHGTMGSSKTANALMINFSYRENGRNSVIIKPAKDSRDGVGKIRSRSGLEAACLCIDEDTDIFALFASYCLNPAVLAKKHPELELPNETQPIDVIIADEAQFFSAKQIDQLADIADSLDVPVIAYGLRSDFTSHLFDGSKRLFEIADKIEEVKHICWCGRKALMNARFDANGIVRSGEQVVIGANEQYTPLCRIHFKSGELTG